MRARSRRFATGRWTRPTPSRGPSPARPISPTTRPAPRARSRAGSPECMTVRPDPNLVLIVAGVTGIVTSVTMIGPLLVDISRDLDVSLGQAGLLAAAAGVPQALFSPFSGLLSDRLGRQPMIVMAFGSVAVLSGAAALAPRVPGLGVARLPRRLPCALPPPLPPAS